MDILNECKNIFGYINDISSFDEKVNVINCLKIELNKYSPFKNEPVDCVLWKKNDIVYANNYNPNSVAPPEMELLRVSIKNDGYTQPIVSYKRSSDKYEIVDGFHRNRVGKEYDDIRQRVFGYLPIVTIKKTQEKRNDRIASTIRHNRARGKHSVDSMTDIVVELKRRNWSNNRIQKELGMDQDEILRLCQVSGLSEMFLDDEFSNSWDIDIMTEEDIVHIFDDIKQDKKPDPKRILHTYDKWECYKNGFYENKVDGMTHEECELKYKDLLTDIPLFEKNLERVINEWKNSCEHYLTNDSMNRIAWLGQASACIAFGIPSRYRNGYNLLSNVEKEVADKTALKYLNAWLERNNMQ